MMPSAKLLNSRIFKGLSLLLPLTLAGAIASPTYPQAGPPRTLSVRSDIQEADSKTGIVTARGNVQINYPARQIQATAAQAQYFSRERRIILSGDVYVLLGIDAKFRLYQINKLEKIKFKLETRSHKAAV
jgi:lipopolysaccharide export system protein LptA